MAPLLAEPFLLAEESHMGSHGVPLDSSKSTVSVTQNITATRESSNFESVIYIPYAFAGGITVLAGALVAMLYYYKKYEPPNKKNKAKEAYVIAEEEKLTAATISKYTNVVS